jgi:hypothetical protein
MEFWPRITVLLWLAVQSREGNLILDKLFKPHQRLGPAKDVTLVGIAAAALQKIASFCSMSYPPPALRAEHLRVG